MQHKYPVLFPHWEEEIRNSLLTLVDNSCLCIALFSSEKELLFANGAMMAFFKDDVPWRNIQNPDLERLASIQSEKNLIYSGFVTIGTETSINTSISANVFRKNGSLLIIGGINANQMVDHNLKLHDMNREISNLQRQLMKEKVTLENTLSQLEETNQQLDNLNKTKDKLFSIIAHDLKNPFIVLLGFSDLLIRNVQKYNPEKIREFAQNIHDSSEQTYELLMNLLEWSKLQSGMLISNPERTKPDEIVSSVMQSCEQHSNSKNIKLIKTIEFDDYLWVDNEMLKFMLRNLITNAIKYTFPNGTVKILVQQSGDEVLFKVSDTGIGIAENKLEKLFAIDTQSSTIGTNGEKGTGLGLILCKEFSEKMGGKIWVDSEIDKGSNFIFTIPVSNKST